MVLTKQQIVNRVNEMVRNNEPLPYSSQTKTTTLQGTPLNANISSYTVTGTNRGTVIPASSLTTPTTAYNTYDESNIQHAKEVQKSGNILQKVASTIYLGVNDASVRGSAKDWENFVDSKNAYGVKFSQGEKANTGDAFKDFMANVSGNLFLIPSNLQRQVAGGLMAVSDMTTANANAVKTGNISVIAQQQAKTVKAVGQAGKDYAVNLGQTLSDPEALTAIAITAGLGAGVGSFATKAVNTGSKIKVTTITPKTGNIAVNGNSINIVKGKTVTIPTTGSKSVSITKGTTTDGSKIFSVQTKTGDKVTNSIQSTNTISTTTNGNIVVSTNSKTTTINIGNKSIQSTKGNTGTSVIKTDSNPIGTNGRIQTSTVQSSGTKSKTLSLKSGNLIIAETGKIFKTNITQGLQHIQSGTRTRINTKNAGTTIKSKYTVRNGVTTKNSKLTTTYDIDKIKVDVNIGNTTLQLPGKTGSKSAGRISVKNNELIIIGNKATTLKRVKTTNRNRTLESTTAKTKTNTVKSKKMDYYKKNERGTTSKTKETTKQAKPTKSKDKTEIKGIAKTVNGKIVRIKPEKYVKGVQRTQKEIDAGKITKAEKDFLANRRKNKMSKSGDAEALYNRRLSYGNTKTPIAGKDTGYTIKGMATEVNGKIVRVKPTEYVNGVKKVYQEIQTGKLSKADKTFLENRRKNKLSPSGDAEALYNRRLTGGSTKETAKAQSTGGLSIKGMATTDTDGKIVRVFPEGYVSGVKKVNAEIKSGKLSQADKDFLENRRKNKLSPSGDAEALYNRRLTGSNTATTSKPSTQKQTNKQTNTNTHTVSNGNGTVYAVLTKNQKQPSKSSAKPNTATKQTQTPQKPKVTPQNNNTPVKPAIVTGVNKQSNVVITIPYGSHHTKTSGITTGNGSITVTIQKPTKTTGKTNTGNTTKTGDSKTKTDAKTKTETKSKSGNTNKRKTGTTVKSAVKSAVALARPQKQAVKQEQKPKQKPKSAVSTKNRKKPKLLHLEDETKKRRKTTKTKKSKYAIRKETVNQFGWLGFDPKKAEKPKRMKIL